MSTSKDFNDWILSGQPIMSTEKPQIYYCSGVELINAATGHTITIPLAKLVEMIPIRYGNNEPNTDRTAQLANALETAYCSSIENTSEIIPTRAKYNSTGSHIKEHNHLSAAEVQEIEEFAKFPDFDVKQIMSIYDVSASVVSRIYRAKHAKTSPSFIEYRRTNPV